MIFGVNNHYHNQGTNGGEFYHPNGHKFLGQENVKVVREGFVVFNLDKHLHTVENKIRFAEIVDERLKAKFGKGLEFATCSETLGMDYEDIPKFYEAMREINPGIVTIFTTSSEDNNPFPNVGINHVFENHASEKVIEAVNPSLQDAQEVCEKYSKYFQAQVFDKISKAAQTIVKNNLDGNQAQQFFKQLGL